MPQNFKCIGCQSDKFKSERGLSRHRQSCAQYKQLRTRKTNKISLQPAENDIPASSITNDDITQVPVEGEVTSLDQEDVVAPMNPVCASPPQEYRPSGLPKRKTRLPKRFQDILPAPPPLALAPDPNVRVSDPNVRVSSPTPAPEISSPPTTEHKTDANSYGVYRVYMGSAPSFTPDDNFRIDSVTDSPNFAGSGPLSNASWGSPFGIDSTDPESVVSFSNHPFANLSICRLMLWFYSGVTKTLKDLNNLVYNVLLVPDFKLEDLTGFDASKEAKRLDEFRTLGSDDTPLKDGWIKGSVSIPLPCARKSFLSEADVPKYKVEGVYYRKPLDVIRAAFEEQAAESFHPAPYKEYWQPRQNDPPERMYSELYNTDAFVEEHEKIKSQPRNECQLETVIAAIMVWSDSTHLTSFGDASLSPIYLYLGNQSKYARAKPSAFAAHHLAYILKLDDDIQDAYREIYGKPASPAVLTHLRRELMQAVWFLLLDNEFMDAYVNGIVLEFPDGVHRRVFPRFFTYSADYPEKVLLAGIKYLGNFPCPRCQIKQCNIHELGTKLDMKQREKLARIDDEHRRNNIEIARRWIFTKGTRVNAKLISSLLGSNTFFDRLGPLGFDFYWLFVVDLLHEFELGIWKAIFTHLIRILYAQGRDAVQVLNERYRQMPTFGRDAIRKFCTNVSEMKKLAGRDFEDLLQCAIPAFEGLLDDKNNVILMDLLFELATWHSLAKLRLHTESTLDALENSTTRLGTILRKFESSTCADFVTTELPTEEATRVRRKAAKAKKKGQKKTPMSEKAKGKQRATSAAPTQQRRFALSTYKLHCLADYAKAIRSEREHRRCKQFYPRVHKGSKHYTIGIANHVRRERILRNISKKNGVNLQRPAKKRRKNPSGNPSIPLEDTESLPKSQPEKHYQMSHDTRHAVPIARYLGDHQGDPAIKDFLPCLKDHLLARLLKQNYDGDENPFSEEERASVKFAKHQIFQHKVLRVNYTTYDMRREQDSLNPRTHANIMVLAHDDSDGHPYWYARIIGIYHAMVIHPSSRDPIAMDFLWIWWYGKDPNTRYKSGWKSRRLPRVGFVEDNDDGSPTFGFLDPANVIRGVHIIPAFKDGKTDTLLEPSLARLPHESDYDYCFYYVNIFVDRDMMMRYRGGGVGHTSTREATDWFLRDRDKLDIASGFARKEAAKKSTGPTSAEDDEGNASEPEGDGNGTDRASEEEFGKEDRRNENQMAVGEGDAEGSEVEVSSNDEAEDQGGSNRGSDQDDEASDSDDENGNEEEVVDEEMDFGYAMDEEANEDEEDEGLSEEESRDDALGPEDGLDVDDEHDSLGYANP